MKYPIFGCLFLLLTPVLSAHEPRPDSGLGEVVRRVDGRPFEHYVREEIFEPTNAGTPTRLAQPTRPVTRPRHAPLRT